MRLPSDEQRARNTIIAAVDAGITVFDTAHAYGAAPGENECLLAGALRDAGSPRARIVTKGGMTRPSGAWVPDGRAKAVQRDCEASLAALDGWPIDTYLIHAPDPRTPWRTSVRALAQLVERGLVARVGVSNVNRRQLDEALHFAPVSAIEVALNHRDDRAVRGGLVDRCQELGIALIAHSPLGGPRRAAALRGDEQPAQAPGASPAQAALARLIALSPVVVAIPGATRPQTATSAAGAARLQLGRTSRKTRKPARRQADAEAVIVMGIPGAGKTRLVQEYIARGYLRLNRDERGGSMRALARALDEALGSGVRHAALDNTFLSRAIRSYVVEVATRHGVGVRCVWLNTPLAQAQVNLVLRLLDHFDALPTPAQVRELARRAGGVMLPTSQMRALRELEPPSADEGFAEVVQRAFTRAPGSEQARAGVFVAATALHHEELLAAGNADLPHLVFDWRPEGDPASLDADIKRLRATIKGPLDAVICPHGGGPPSCWCRPPLPGLPLAFARAHGVDPSRSVLIGSSPAHRTLATTLGARYVAA